MPRSWDTIIHSRVIRKSVSPEFKELRRRHVGA